MTGGRLIVEEIHGGVLVLEVAAFAVRWPTRGHVVIHGSQRSTNCTIVHSLCFQLIRYDVSG